MSHQDLYVLPEIYDIAFGYRDVVSEMDALLACAGGVLGRSVESVLELASGPGRHALECALRGVRTYALDCSAEMLAFCAQRAREYGVEIHCIRGDMRDFEVPQQVDLALLMLDSLSYMLTNEDVVRHLRAVADVLVVGGVYVVDMCHPRGLFERASFVPPSWTATGSGLRVHTQWGAVDDAMDPISQCTCVTARFEVKDAEGQTQVYTAQSMQRAFTACTFEALVMASGCWDIVGRWGAVTLDVPLSNTPEAERMVYVLKTRKTQRTQQFL